MTAQKQPSDRQKALFKYMTENSGISMSQAMKDLGYSEGYAHSPDKIKKTKGWKRLMRKFLPDRKLVKVAREGLEATMVKTSLTEPDRVLPDYAVRHKYLETALKMKGKLVEKTDITSDGKPIPLLNALHNHNGNQEVVESPKED